MCNHNLKVIIILSNYNDTIKFFRSQDLFCMRITALQQLSSLHGYYLTLMNGDTIGVYQIVLDFLILVTFLPSLPLKKYKVGNIQDWRRKHKPFLRFF